LTRSVWLKKPFAFLAPWPAQPVQLNVYPVKSYLHLFLWGLPNEMRSLFNRGEACLTGMKSLLHLFHRGGLPSSIPEDSAAHLTGVQNQDMHAPHERITNGDSLDGLI